jgi:hypothetical protein
MRDLETIALALTAAETGHLVFGTLHTRGAGPSVDRIIDSFPANQQAMIRTMLSESLAAVISQSLLKRKDKGRVAAYEILIVNHAIANLIREGKTFQMPSIIQTSRKEGMMLMDHYILDLVDKGWVDAEEAEAYMEDPSALASRRKVLRPQVKQAAPAKPAMTAPPSLHGAQPAEKTSGAAAAEAEHSGSFHTSSFSSPSLQGHTPPLGTPVKPEVAPPNFVSKKTQSSFTPLTEKVEQPSAAPVARRMPPASPSHPVSAKPAPAPLLNDLTAEVTSGGQESTGVGESSIGGSFAEADDAKIEELLTSLGSEDSAVTKLPPRTAPSGKTAADEGTQTGSKRVPPAPPLKRKVG